MLEVLAVYWASLKLRRIAMEKGRSPNSGSWALLWFAGEVAGFAFGYALGVGDFAYVFALGGAAVGAASAFVIVSSMSPSPGWVPGMRWAGWCRKCKANVWLLPDGRCENGHAASKVIKLYVPAGQTPPQGAAPPEAEPVRPAALG